MRRGFSFLLTAILAMLVFAIPVSADETCKAEEYLETYFNITIPEEYTLETANEVLTSLGAEPIEGEEFSEEAVVKAGLKLAGLDELAQTYINEEAPEKAAEVLKEYDITCAEEFAPYVACAQDLGLLEGDDITDFLYHCVELGGKGRHYIGRVSDNEILSKVNSDLNSFSIFSEEELNGLGTSIVLDGAATGYNLKYSGYDAHFLDKYTLKYGHSDIRHAVQLIGLLRSEKMDAYIQIEPKVSVYEYMMDWGDPGDPTPTYEVREVDENRYLCYAVEYDLEIEFDTTEEKEAFHGIIERYAKKYDDRVDEDGNITKKLLAESWWQPLYSSYTPMENEEFGELTENVIYDADGNYSIHSFTLPEDAEKIAEETGKIAPDLKVGTATIYVNPAFMRYIKNEDHQ